jgi:hypothetical protein
MDVSIDGFLCLTTFCQSLLCGPAATVLLLMAAGPGTQGSAKHSFQAPELQKGTLLNGSPHAGLCLCSVLF